MPHLQPCLTLPSIPTSSPIPFTPPPPLPAPSICPYTLSPTPDLAPSPTFTREASMPVKEAEPVLFSTWGGAGLEFSLKLEYRV